MQVQITALALWRHTNEDAGALVTQILTALGVGIEQVIVIPLAHGGEKVEAHVRLGNVSSADLVDGLAAWTGSAGFNLRVFVEAGAPAPAWWSALATPFQVTPARDGIPVYTDKGITPWPAHPTIGKAWGVMNVSLVDGEWLEVNPANPQLWVRGADVAKV